MTIESDEATDIGGAGNDLVFLIAAASHRDGQTLDPAAVVASFRLGG